MLLTLPRDSSRLTFARAQGVQRRDFIGLIGATALSIPRLGYAQTKTDMPLVGFLLVQKSDTTIAKDRIIALRKGLQEEGFIEGGWPTSKTAPQRT
jgi:hypothetical protein